jgi:hypothetical protein
MGGEFSPEVAKIARADKVCVLAISTAGNDQVGPILSHELLRHPSPPD